IGLDIPHLNNLTWQLHLGLDKFVILHQVTYQDKTHYDVHRILRAIAKNTLLSKLSKSDYAGDGEIMLEEQELVGAFARFPSVISKTMEVINTCSIEMEFHTDKNRKYFTTSAEDDSALLRKLAMEGCKVRYGLRNKIALERV